MRAGTAPSASEQHTMSHPPGYCYHQSPGLEGSFLKRDHCSVLKRFLQCPDGRPRCCLRVVRCCHPRGDFRSNPRLLRSLIMLFDRGVPGVGGRRLQNLIEFVDRCQESSKRLAGPLYPGLTAMVTYIRPVKTPPPSHASARGLSMSPRAVAEPWGQRQTWFPHLADDPRLRPIRRANGAERFLEQTPDKVHVRDRATITFTSSRLYSARTQRLIDATIAPLDIVKESADAF